MRGTPALALGASPDVASRPPASFPEAAGPLPAAEGAVSSLEQDREAPSGSHAAGAPGTTPAASAPATELGSTTVVPAAAPPVASEVSPAETRAPEPAPGNPTSAPLDPGGPVEQIAAATRLHLRGRGAGTLEMHLEPAALGRLRLQVTLQEGSLAAYLGTESHAAQQLLMDQAPALRAALQESGLPVETVQIGLELGFAPRRFAAAAGGCAGGGWRQQTTRRRHRPGSTPPAAVAGLVTTTCGSQSGERLALGSGDRQAVLPRSARGSHPGALSRRSLRLRRVLVGLIGRMTEWIAGHPRGYERGGAASALRQPSGV